MTKAKKKTHLPEWMQPYIQHINNTGGNDVEELVNDDGTNSNVFNNAPRALICVSVKSQVQLLKTLHEKGLLNPSRTLLVKLGSVIVHAEEFMSHGGHPFDKIAFDTELKDAEVRAWMKEMDENGFLPTKR
jgi:hypothetical protein